jgi:hypothetical protein
MYSTLLLVHSWVRWLAIVAAMGATLAVVRGKVEGDRSIADRWGVLLVTSLDIQLLLGLILYLVVSPNMAEIRAHFAEAMRSSQLRFWAVEHLTAMLAAVVFAHLGKVLARKAKTVASKRTRLLFCYGLATLLIMIGTPWPGMVYGRPLFRV